MRKRQAKKILARLTQFGEESVSLATRRRFRAWMIRKLGWGMLVYQGQTINLGEFVRQTKKEK